MVSPLNLQDRFIRKRKPVDFPILEKGASSHKKLLFENLLFPKVFEVQKQRANKPSPPPPTPKRCISKMNSFMIKGIVDNYYYNCLDWAKDDLLFVATGSQILFYNPREKEFSLVFNCKNQISSIKSMDRGIHLTFATMDSVLVFSDIEKQKEVWSTSTNGITYALTNVQEDLLAIGGENNQTLSLYDVRTGPVIIQESNHKETNSILWDNRNPHLLLNAGEESISFLDLRRLDRCLQSYLVDAVKPIVWHPCNPDILYVGRTTGKWTIEVYNTVLAKEDAFLFSIDTDAVVSALLPSPDGKELFSTQGFHKYGRERNHSYALMWDIKKDFSLQWRGNLSHHQKRILTATRSPDGQFVATMCSESVAFWRTWPHQPSREFLPILR